MKDRKREERWGMGGGEGGGGGGEEDSSKLGVEQTLI